MKARYYDPEIGRFMGMDPAGVLANVESNPQMFNRYAYGNNNPYKYVDPDGRASKVASFVTMTGSGIKKLGRLTKEQAVRVRRQGGNIHSDTKQVQKQIEVAANIKNNKILDHSQGHILKNADGSVKVGANGEQVKGAGHIQTDGVKGHNFAGSQGVVNSVLIGVGSALESIGSGLESAEKNFPRTMRLLDPVGTLHEQGMERSKSTCDNCEA